MPSGWECLSRAFLGHTGEALAGQERAVAVARTAGMVGHVVVATGRLAMRYMAAGQVDRGLAVAHEGFEEGLALGLPVQAALCGSAGADGARVARPLR